MEMMLEAMFEKFGKIFQKNEIIFCENEPGNDFYLIQDGKVKITKTVGDSIKTLDVLSQGDIFGEMAILEAEPRSATAIAVTDVRTLQFNRANFELLMNKNPMMALKILKIFAIRINDAKRRLLILLLDDLQGKIADVFLMLHEKNSNDFNLKEVTFEISVEDIADWCAEPVGEVQRVLNNLVKNGKIDVFEEKIVVHNINDFLRLVAQKRKPS